MWPIWLLLHQIWVNLKWRKLITWMHHRFLEHHTESRACISLSQEWEYLDQDTSLHMLQCIPSLPLVWSIYLQVCEVVKERRNLQQNNYSNMSNG
jgi:hypothetical protein